MTDPTNARRLRHLLFAMVVVLTFEGIVRKASPMGLRIPLFFLKDFIALIMAVYVIRMPMAAMIKSLWAAYMLLGALMLPSILMTAYHDPFLAVFGVKQYLLYPMVGFATFLAFEDSRQEEILAFFRWIALLVIPTAALALLQSRLPADSWVNMSVTGGTLGNFSAAGELRVSSSFSFVAQYCAFLNAEIFIIMIALHGWMNGTLIWKIATLSLVPAIVLGCFITGSRGAVVGNLSIILVALVLAAMKFRVRDVFQILFVMVLLYLAVFAVRHFSPSSMAAYSAREDGRLIGFSSEVRGRVFDSYFNLLRDKSLHTFFGNGLGVMSNGSDVLSSYAAFWRVRLWTETDFSTTLFEGGYYLAFVWYGFRLFVILKTFAHFMTDVTPEYSVPMAFCQGFVIVLGTLGTLALQPPVAIWWWLGVGTSLVFSWKCIEPPEVEKRRQEIDAPPPRKKIRGRSLYADVIHPRK